MDQAPIRRKWKVKLSQEAVLEKCVFSKESSQKERSMEMKAYEENVDTQACSKTSPRRAEAE